MRDGLLGLLLVSLVVLTSPVWAQQGLLINGSRTIAGTINAATTTGTGSAYLMVLDPPITEYVINQCFTFRAHVTNTGAATLNVNGVAIRPLKKYVGTAVADLVAGDITSGQIVFACYDGAVMQVVGGGLASGSETSSSSDAHVLTTQAEASLDNEVNLGALPSGLLKHSVSGGVSTPGAAVAGTDYQAPLGFTAENSANKKSSTALGTSNTDYPTVGAVKGYVDAATRLPGDGMVNASGYGVTCDGVTQTAAALQNALNTMPAGATLLLPHGTCVLNATLTITRSLTVRGAGMNLTTLQQSVANQPVLSVTATNVHLEGFTATHSGTPVTGGDGVVIHQDAGLDAISLHQVAAHRNWRGFVLGCIAYGWGDKLQANNNNNNGFEFIYPAACGVAQWDIAHSISQLNKGAGFTGLNNARTDAIGPWLTETVSFGNNQGGYVFQSTAGHALYDIRLKNVLSSSDNVIGIYLNTYGAAHLISDPWVEYVGELGGFPLGTDGVLSVASHTGHCLGLSANNQPGIAITGGLYWNCAWSGVALDAPYSSLTGGTSMGNGLALNPALYTRAGVHIAGTGVSVTGHTFVNINPPTTLHYIHLQGPLERLAIGSNTYMAGLPEEAFIDATEATLPSTLLGTVREPAEREQAAGALIGEYILSGCLPAAPPGSLILPAFACTGFVHDSSVPPRLTPVRQVAASVGPLSGGDGTYWLALHRDKTSAVSGWTRQSGTHYLWQKATTQPVIPNGQVVSKITVAGGLGTAVDDLRVPGSYVREGAYVVTDPLYGGVADDTTDVGPALQAAIRAVVAQRGGMVRLPQGVYALNSAVTIPEGITLHGDGWAPPTPLLVSTTEPRRGTWLHIRSAAFLPLTITGNGTTVRGIAFDHDQPAPTAGWAPTAYPYTIQINTPATWTNGDITLDNLFFFRATHGINQASVSGQSGGRLTLRNIYGQFFTVGIRLEFLADVSRVSDVHMWPYWSQDQPVLDWQVTTTTGLLLRRADSLNLHNLFVFAANIGMNFEPNPFGPSTGYLATNIQLDFVRTGLASTQPDMNGQIANLRVAGGWNGVTNLPLFEAATGIVITAANNRLRIANYEGLSFGHNCAKVSGAQTLVTFSNVWCRIWNLHNENVPGLLSSSGGAIALGGTQAFDTGGGALAYSGTFVSSQFPGGAQFNQAGDFFLNVIGGNPTLNFGVNDYLQWLVSTNRIKIGTDAGTYSTGGVLKHLCIQDGELIVCP